MTNLAEACQAAVDDFGLPVRVLPAMSLPGGTLIRAHGVALATFESGRTEPRQWSATMAMSDAELSQSDVARASLVNFLESMRRFQVVATRAGWKRHNRKGRRRVASLAWARP